MAGGRNRKGKKPKPPANPSGGDEAKPVPAKAVPEESKPATEAPDPGQQRSKWTAPNIVLSIFNTILALVVALATVITAIVADRSADIATDTLILSQRAWLHFGGFAVVGLEGEYPRLQFVITNTGNRPATLQRYQFGFQQSTLPPIPKYDRERDLAGIQISPGQPLRQDIALNAEGVLAELRKIISLDSRFWFFVRVVYYDGFNDRVVCSIVERNVETGELQIAPQREYHCNE